MAETCTSNSKYQPAEKKKKGVGFINLYLIKTGMETQKPPQTILRL